MDELPLTFNIPVNRTVEKTGTNTVSVRTTRDEKSSFTVVLGAQANCQKLPPMVIFKRKTLPKEIFPAGIIIKANTKGWMDEEKISEWLREVYVKRPDGFFHKSPSILICDSMRAHLTDSVKAQVKQTNSVLAIILGGLTKELHLLGIVVNRLLSCMGALDDRRRTHIHQDREAALGELRHDLPMDHGCLG